jgi:hypothetical protein
VRLAGVRGFEQFGDERSQRLPGRGVDGLPDGQCDGAEVGADIEMIAGGGLIGAAQHDVVGLVGTGRAEARVGRGSSQTGSKQGDVSDDLCRG